jgi:hypothetical protein
MITLDQNIRPKALNLTGNPVLAKMQGDRMWAVNGVKAILQVLFPEWPDTTYYNNTSPPDYRWLQFAWGTNVLKVYFKPAPLVDDSGTSFPMPVQEISFDWVADFADFMRSVYVFDKDFTIEVDESKFTIRAREKGADYNITLTKHSALTTTSTPYSTLGVNAVMQDNYRLYAQLRNDDQDIIAEESITPDSQGIATIDLAEYLESEIEKQRLAGGQQFTYPSDADLVVARPDFLLDFELRIGEMWGGNARLLKTYSGFQALLGGLSKAKLDELAARNLTFYDLVTENTAAPDVPRFLTFQPASKITGENTPERLFFFKNVGYESYVKRVEHYSNGTEVSYIHEEIPFAAGVYEIVCTANRNLPLVSMDFYVVDNDDEVTSEIKTFVIDHTYYRHEYYFMFRNSLGAYDTLRCTGVLKYKPEFDRETFTNDDDETGTLQVLMEQVYEANTGSLTADMALWINDFMLSKEVYWLKDNVAYQVVVSSKKKTAIADDDRRFTVDFEFSIAAKDKYFSVPEVGAGFNINQPATGEIPISG